MKPSAHAASAPGVVHLIGGIYKRSRLVVLARAGLRPTPQRLRETLFNWLGQDLGGWRCLDAFAGSGALGLEAASRGAAQVLLLEHDAALAEQLARTVQRLGASAVQVRRAETLSEMARLAVQFDLILLDPPFQAGLHKPALAAALPRLAPGGVIYLEDAIVWSPERFQDFGLRLVKHARAGAVHAHLCSAQIAS